MNRWKLLSVGLGLVVGVETALLVRHEMMGSEKSSAARQDDGFETFESVAFAKEFGERLLSFDSQTFRSSQTAVAFLMNDENRARRLSEVERLQEKIEKTDVSQRARLVTLTKLAGKGERFRADLVVELSEGRGAQTTKTEFSTELEFSIERTTRSAQNTWGFLVKEISQRVVPSNPDLSTSPVLRLKPGLAALVRFPCSIENVELPKGTSVRVKLTTLDISELQMRTETAFDGEQPVKAVCRDRAFTMKLESPRVDSGGEALVVFKSLAMENSTAMLSDKKPRKKLGIEKSIEEQLGFVLED